jgi:hypothetical protein
VKAFWNQITEATAGAPMAHTGSLRRLLGLLLEAAAISLKRGSPRMAPFVAVNAVLNDPSYLMQPGRLLSLYRALTREPANQDGDRRSARS